jgi:hypothetical protein
MQEQKMKSIYGKMLLAALVSITFIALPAHAATKHVNCYEGQTISAALETAKGSADVLEIFVSGFCDERITVPRDRVTIQGDGTAVINGGFRIFSKNSVLLWNLTITGPFPGLVTSGSSSVNLFDVVFDRNESFANLVMRRNAAVFLRDSHIIGDCESTEDMECADGAVVDASTLVMSRSSVSNAVVGIAADAGARVILQDRLGDNSKVFNNSAVGIRVALKSLVDLRGTTHLHDNPHLAFHVLDGSAVRIESPGVTIDGFITCEDSHRSFLANPHGVPVPTDCWW